MRKQRYIVSLVLCALSLSAFSRDYTRLTERTIMGTARYVGMGGAMSAIGGDPSSVMDNVAGLGIYRRPEAMLTLDYASFVMAPQSSIVFSLPTTNPEGLGVQYHNFMFNYHRLHSYSANIEASAEHQPSLGALFAAADGEMGIPFAADRYCDANALKITERGYVNEYAFDYAMNIADRWYWGIGLHIHSFSMSSEADYAETFGNGYYNRNRTTVLMNGAGCSLATGLICRPTSWLRLGFGLQTPSFGSVTTTTTGTFDAQTDSLRWSDAPEHRSAASDQHMPLQLSTSVAFQINRYAMIALQYNYRHVSSAPDAHSLRAGVEVVPFPGLYLNAGYAYESPFRTTYPVVSIDPSLNSQDAYFSYPHRQQYISCAIGYRGRYFIAQAAYQYQMKRTHLYAHENADAYLLDRNTHRIVLTVAWHRP
ncbi:MAG: hypothetical protein IJ249_06745 [Paludibacteraceae bacterium]|nr:hypothetical protein [Paludibacteraceae bacterium]